MRLFLLAIIGMVEAVVWLWRCRTANQPSAPMSALSTIGTTATRLAFVWVGASAVIADVPWWHAAIAYVLPAGLVTLWTHPRRQS